MTNLLTRRVVIVLAAVFFTSGVIAAEPHDADGNGGSVLERVQPLAEQGNPKAQYNLGVIYDRGYGVQRDYAKARIWYEKAAAQGNAAAAHNLGMMYKQGHGVPVDYGQAADWFKKAARLGEPAAQNNLAVMYAEGMGVDENPVLAAIWMARAAQAGNQAAIDNLPVIIANLPEAKIAGNNVNIRAQSSTKSDVLTRLDAGAQVVVLEQRDDWTRVLIPSGYTLGWIASSLLDGSVQLAAAGDTADTDGAIAPPEDGGKELLAEVRHEVAADGTAASAEAAVADSAPAAGQTPADSSGQEAGDAGPEPAVADTGASAGQPSEPVVKTVGADTVNLRDKPSRQADILSRVHRGDRLTILKSRNGWDYVETTGGQHGWIAGYLLTGG